MMAVRITSIYFLPNRYKRMDLSKAIYATMVDETSASTVFCLLLLTYFPLHLSNITTEMNHKQARIVNLESYFINYNNSISILKKSYESDNIANERKNQSSSLQTVVDESSRIQYYDCSLFAYFTASHDQLEDIFTDYNDGTNLILTGFMRIATCK